MADEENLLDSPLCWLRPVGRARANGQHGHLPHPIGEVDALLGPFAPRIHRPRFLFGPDQIVTRRSQGMARSQPMNSSDPTNLNVPVNVRKPLVESSHDKLEDMLSCAICMERFTQPRLLLCGHTFCLNCLEHFAGSAASVSCPTCRKVSNSKVGDLSEDFRLKTFEEAMAGLPKNPSPKICSVCKARDAFSFCLICDLSLCGDCNVKHREGRLTSSHSVILVEDMIMCDKHGKPCGYVCYDCNGCVCKLCALKECGQHAIMTYRETIDSYKDASNKINLVDRCFKRLKEDQKNIFQNAEEKINKFAEEIQMKVSQEKDTLIKKLNEMRVQSLTAMDGEMKKQKESIHLLSSNQAHVSNEAIPSSLIHSILACDVIPQDCLREVVINPAHSGALVASVEFKTLMADWKYFHELEDKSSNQ